VLNIIIPNLLKSALTDFQGEVAALLAACLWAVASVVYGFVGKRIPPLQLNLIKGVVAIALLLLTIFIRGELFPSISPLPFFLLLMSGVVGIGLGDTAFLAAINSLGARRVLLIGTLAPPITAILALIFLQEHLNFGAWCGILLTILGVAWVITERTPSTPNTDHTSTTPLWQGIGLGLLTAMTNATGAVLSRAALANTSVSPLWAALLRLGAGVVILLIWLSFSKQNRNFQINNLVVSRQVILAAIFASFCGTYLGIWLQQTALKFTVTGISFTLLQTSPLFVIPLNIWMGETVSLRAIAGVMVAITGIALLFLLK